MDTQINRSNSSSVSKCFLLKESIGELWVCGNFISRNIQPVNFCKSKFLVLILLFACYLSSCSVTRQFQKNTLNSSAVDLSIRTESPSEANKILLSDGINIRSR